MPKCDSFIAIARELILLYIFILLCTFRHDRVRKSEAMKKSGFFSVYRTWFDVRLYVASWQRTKNKHKHTACFFLSFSSVCDWWNDSFGRHWLMCWFELIIYKLDWNKQKSKNGNKCLWSGPTNTAWSKIKYNKKKRALYDASKWFDW